MRRGVLCGWEAAGACVSPTVVSRAPPSVRYYHALLFGHATARAANNICLISHRRMARAHEL